MNNTIIWCLFLLAMANAVSVDEEIGKEIDLGNGETLTFRSNMDNEEEEEEDDEEGG